MAQLVEWLLPTSKMVRIQTLCGNCFYQLYKKDENVEKEAGNGPYLKNSNSSTTPTQYGPIHFLIYAPLSPITISNTIQVLSNFTVVLNKTSSLSLVLSYSAIWALCHAVIVLSKNTVLFKHFAVSFKNYAQRWISIVPAQWSHQWGLAYKKHRYPSTWQLHQEFPSSLPSK